jgi:hypothetical protein
MTLVSLEDPVGLFGDAPRWAGSHALSVARFMIFARPASPSPFLAAESGRHVDAAEAVA